MSELDHALANASQSVITIGIKAGSQLVVALRDFLNFWYMNANDGPAKYKETLKATKGAAFRDEVQFANVTFNEKGSDLMREPVSKDERALIARMCKREGMDYCLAKRPPHLEKLLEAKYIQGVKLSPQQEKMLNAFICFDPQGKPVFETEVKGHRVPKLRDDQYLLTIAEKDLPKWDHLCTLLEVSGKRSIRDIARDIQARDAIEKAAETPSTDPKTKQPEKKNEKKPAKESEPVRMLRFSLPKKQTEDNEKPKDYIVVKVSAQDQILIPVQYIVTSTADEYVLEIPDDVHVEVRNGDRVTKKPVKEVKSYMVPVTQSKSQDKVR